MKDKFKKISNQLIDLGQFDLADKVLCALAAINENTAGSYSATMRELRKNKSDKKDLFQKKFNEAFNNALDEELENPEQIALMYALKSIGETLE